MDRKGGRKTLPSPFPAFLLKRFFFGKTIPPFGNNGSIWTRELGGHFRSEKGYCEGWQRMSPTLMTSPLSQRPVFIFIPPGEPVRSIRPLEAISEDSLTERR